MDVSSLIAGRKARWLVTGAAGFIGSHLAESLALAGQSVIAIDDFSTGKQANIDAIMPPPEPQGRTACSSRKGPSATAPSATVSSRAWTMCCTRPPWAPCPAR